MTYDILVLDLDGTLTNSEKKITPPTREALIEIQQNGKKVVLASGRPTPGVVSLAKELHLGDYGSYILSFNGGKIINCSTGEAIYNKILPSEVTSAVYEIASQYDVDLLTYTEHEILSGISRINILSWNPRSTTCQSCGLRTSLKRLPSRSTNF